MRQLIKAAIKVLWFRLISSIPFVEKGEGIHIDQFSWIFYIIYPIKQMTRREDANFLFQSWKEIDNYNYFLLVVNLMAVTILRIEKHGVV